MNSPSLSIRRVNVKRYIAPLREGGSLPAIAEADDGFLYVIKFKGAGQGPKALIAEFIGGEIARTAGLHVPEIVFAALDPAFGRTEPDPEIQDLLKASTGLNLGLHFLKSAAMFDPVATRPDPLSASMIVWLDCFITNVDRTAKNTNLLWWNKEIWLIDHGASLYFHHLWSDYMEKSAQPFELVKDHVLLTYASELEKAQKIFLEKISPEKIKTIVNTLPDDWLLYDAPFRNAEDNRNAYAEYLIKRLENSDTFTQYAIHARESII
ncbi:MAG: aminotransferase class I and II [Chitinophagaceae bacterium]|nr:aminotransferase class I and II [Chitinophagaceae bacterium]